MNFSDPDLPADASTGQEGLPAATVQTPDDPASREASRKGWVTQDKFTGDPADWVDAATFLDRGEKIASNLRKRLDNTEAQLARFKKTADQFQKFHEESMARKDAELGEAIQQLRLQRSEAIRNGDDDDALQLEDRIDVLKDERKAAKAAAVAPAEEAPQVSPEIQAWVEDGNSWFTSDLRLQQYAVSLSNELIAKGETLRGRPFLDKITSIMKEDFPAKFGNPLRGRAGSVEGGAAAGSSVGGKSAKDLPQVDRELMQSFVKEGWTTEAKFLKDYFSR